MARASQPTPAARRWVLAASTLGAGLVILDVTAMNVVAPVIQQDLDGPVTLLQWVLNAYTLFLASILLLGGALADRFGRRLVFALGAALFAAASLACALAPGPLFLIAARAVQGLGGALLIPAGLGLLAAHYTGQDRGRAIGLWGGLSGVAAIAGPLLGGILADFASWRWVFVMYVVVALAVLLILILRVPAAKRPPEARRLDVPGAVLVTAGLFGVVFALIRVAVTSWSDPLVITALALGGALLLGFALQQALARTPLIDLARLRDRDFAAAQVVTLLVYFALAAGMLFVPMRLMYLEGWGPALAGIGVLPTIVLIALLSPRAGALLPRLGARPLAIAGALICAVGYVTLAVPAQGVSYWAGTFWGMLLVGVGMALLIAPVTATVLSAAPAAESARAAGLNNAVSRLGALLAIAVAGIVALAAQGVIVEDGLGALELDEDEEADARTARLDYGAAEPPAGIDEEQQAALRGLYHAGFLAGYRAVQLLMAATAVLGALAAIFLTREAGRA